tara:strand:+ start:8496 stop:9575 length:1080 start_codon:yes stop_codon:yes gene_type:complete
LIIIKGHYGALGNRLWQFAYLIAFGIENKIIISYPGFYEYAKYFNLTRNNIFCSFPSISIPFKVPEYIRCKYFNSVPLVKRLLLRINRINKIYSHHWVKTGEYFDLDKESEFLKSNKIVTLEGWLTRCNKSFIKHSSSIKYLLTPVRKYREKSDRLHKKLRMKYELIIGVHIRKDLSDLYGGIDVGSNKAPSNISFAQKKLTKMGYDLGIEEINGIWGEKSKKAFQKYKDNTQNIFLGIGEKDHSLYTFEEYANLVKGLQKLFKNKKIAFLISSDTKVDLTHFNRLPIYLATGHFIEDNYNLSKCDYIIGPQSTFTYWSSFYGSVPLFPFSDSSNRFDLSDEKRINIELSNFKVCNHLF